MSLHLYFAPTIDMLLPQFLSSITAAWRDPLSPPTIIVPGPAMGNWLTMRIAEEKGCVLNLQPRRLERFLWETLVPDTRHRMLTLGQLQHIVCAELTKVLQTPATASDLYAEVRAYVDADPVKRLQLATQVAHLFEEYEYNRPSYWNITEKVWATLGVEAHWLKDKSYFARAALSAGGAVPASIEAWQMDLYQRIFNATGPLCPAGDLISLPRLYGLRHDNLIDNRELWIPKTGTVFLFHVAQMSHFHRNFLLEISQQSSNELYVMLSNPCAEFWEDVDTRRRGARPRRFWHSAQEISSRGIKPMQHEDYTQSALTTPVDHALLELWGHTGKENTTLWCQAAEYDFSYIAADNDSDQFENAGTVLQKVQKSLRDRDDRPVHLDPAMDDQSIQIYSAPGLYQEVQNLRGLILQFLHEGIITTLDDVAIYLPDPGVHYSSIHQVFGGFSPQDPGYMPFTFVGNSAVKSLFSQGIETLLRVAQGDFTRAEIFTFFENPLIYCQLRVTEEQIAIWAQWCGALGIFRGYDSPVDAHSEEQIADVTSPHTFDQGMVRGMLGNLADGPIDLGISRGMGTDFNAVYLFKDQNTGNTQLYEKFCDSVERLNSDILRLRSAIHSGSIQRCVDVTIALVETWFAEHSPQHYWNESFEARCRRGFLDALPELLLQATPGGRSEPLTVDEFCAMARTMLPKDVALQNKAWTGSLTFAALTTANIIPCRCMFILGLDAQGFPGVTHKPPFNLLSYRRIIGDPDAVRDNRFVFLEALQAAACRLVLSFRGRNIQKDEVLQPSSVILELEAFLRSFIMDKSHPVLIRKEIPLTNHEALSERSIVADWDEDISTIRALESVLGQTGRALYRYPLSGQAQIEETGAPSLRTIKGACVKRFFRNPLEYALLQTLGGSSDEEENARVATDEPVEGNRMALNALKRVLLSDVLKSMFPLNCEDAADLEASQEVALNSLTYAYQKIVAEGLAPEAVFALMEYADLKNWAISLVKELQLLRARFIDHQLLLDIDFSLGREQSKAHLEVALGDASLLSIDHRHAFALIPRDLSSNKQIGLLALNSKKSPAENPDLWMDTTLQWLYDKGTHSLVTIQVDIYTAGVHIAEWQLHARAIADKPAPYDEVISWLQKLLDEMIRERICEHLPVMAVKKIMDSNFGAINGLTAESLQEILAQEHSPYQCFIPSFALIEKRVPSENLTQRYHSRLAPFIEGRLYG